MSKNKVIKPIELSRLVSVVPQYLYSMIREGKVPSHECVCGHTYLLYDEVIETKWFSKLTEENQNKITKAYSK